MAQRICALWLTGVTFFALRIAGLCDLIVSAGSRPFRQSEEAWAGPVTAGDLARDHRQRPPVAAPPFEGVFSDDHGVGLTSPFAEELGSRPEAGNATACDVAVPLQGLREVCKTPFGCGAEAAIGVLLELPGDPEQEQVAPYAFGRMGAIEPPPLRAQGGAIHLLECPQLGRDVVGAAESVRNVSAPGASHGCRPDCGRRGPTILHDP